MEDPKKSLVATKKLLEEVKLRSALAMLLCLEVRSDALPKPRDTIKLQSNTSVAEALKVTLFPTNIFKLSNVSLSVSCSLTC
jgi:hypothetical protein